MKTLINNRVGMSLVEVMVTIGVAAIVMLAMANSMSTMFKNQSTVMKKDMGNEFTASFSNAIHQADICTAYLSGIPLAPTGDPVPFVIDDYITNMSDDAVTNANPVLDDLKNDAKVDEGLFVSTLTIQNSKLPDSPIEYEGTTFVRRVAFIQLRMKMKMAGTDRDMKARNFQIPVLVDPSNDIISRCAGGMAITDACAAIGAEDKDGDGRCDATENCFLRGTYTQVSCRGSVRPPASCTKTIPNRITGALDCPPGALASKTGETQHQYDEDCGKKCTNRVTEDIVYWICLSCS